MNTAVLILVLFGAVHDAPSAWVIPESATEALQAVLGTDGAKLDDRLVLQAAEVDRDRILIRYGVTKEGETTLSLTLRHPDAFDDGSLMGPFVVAGQTGDDPSAVQALAARLARLARAQVWQAQPGNPEPKSDSRAAPADYPAAGDRWQHLLDDADHALQLGEATEAVRHLDALMTDRTLPAPLILDAVQGYRRAKADSQAKAGLARYEAGAGQARDPVSRWRSAALGGQRLSMLKVLSDITSTKDGCGAADIAGALDAMGLRSDGYILLDGAARETECLEAEATLLAWFVADGRIQEAAELSTLMSTHAPEVEAFRIVRANLLLAAGKAKEAAALLAPIVTEQPESGQVAVYASAQIRALQPDATDQLVAQSDASPGDALAALVAGVALQQAGKTSESEARLTQAATRYDSAPSLHLTRARNAFDLGDRDTAYAHLARARALASPSVDYYTVQGELLRWTDASGARDALKRALVLSDKASRGLVQDTTRREAQIAHLDACIAAKEPLPCPGPFDHPRGHEANIEVNDGEGSTFGNGLIIFGVLLIFVLIVRQGRINKSARTRWEQKRPRRR